MNTENIIRETDAMLTKYELDVASGDGTNNDPYVFICGKAESDNRALEVGFPILLGEILIILRNNYTPQEMTKDLIGYLNKELEVFALLDDMMGM